MEKILRKSRTYLVWTGEPAEKPPAIATPTDVLHSTNTRITVANPSGWKNVTFRELITKSFSRKKATIKNQKKRRTSWHLSGDIREQVSGCFQKKRRTSWHLSGDIREQVSGCFQKKRRTSWHLSGIIGDHFSGWFQK
jgi:hypothetical protein